MQWGGDTDFYAYFDPTYLERPQYRPHNVHTTKGTMSRKYLLKNVLRDPG
jgi:hypothetical protein